MKTTKKYTLWFIILLCISILIPHFGKFPVVEDWGSFIIAEICGQLLISNKQ